MRWSLLCVLLLPSPARAFAPALSKTRCDLYTAAPVRRPLLTRLRSSNDDAPLETASEASSLRSEGERLLLQAERLKLAAERESLELARAKLRMEQMKIQEKVVAAPAGAQSSGVQSSTGKVSEQLQACVDEGRAIVSELEDILASSEGLDSIQRRMEAVQERKKSLKAAETSALAAREEVLLRSEKQEEDSSSVQQGAESPSAPAPSSASKTLTERMVTACVRNGLSNDQATRAVKVFTQRMAQAKTISERFPYSLICHSRNYLSEERLQRTLDAQGPEVLAAALESSLYMVSAILGQEAKDVEEWDDGLLNWFALVSNRMVQEPDMMDVLNIFLSDDEKSASDSGSSGGPSTSTEDASLLLDSPEGPLQLWRSDHPDTPYFDDADIAALQAHVFTPDLLAGEAERQRDKQTKKSKVGMLRGARPPEGAGQMVSAAGLACVTVTGVTEAEKVWQEAQKRIEQHGLKSKVRLFIQADSGRFLADSEGLEDEMEQAADEMIEELMAEQASPAQAVGQTVGLMFSSFFSNADTFLIVAAPADARPAGMGGGLPLSLLMGAASLYFTWDTVQTSMSAADAPLAAVAGASLMVLGLQAIHELAHALVAASQGVQLSAPRLLPFPLVGFAGAQTQPVDYVQDENALHDIAAAGPAAGIVASSIALFVGLKATAEAPAAAAALFPTLPAYLLQSSFLLGGVINAALPNLALSAPDIVAPAIPLHPLAFAGAAGLFMNALHCLPIASLDGSSALALRVNSSMPSSARALLVGLVGSMAGVVAWVAIAYQVWQSFFGSNPEQEGILAAFVPLVLLFASNGPRQVVDERVQLDKKRILGSAALQAFALAMFYPMPVQNFLADAATAAANSGFF